MKGCRWQQVSESLLSDCCIDGAAFAKAAELRRSSRHCDIEIYRVNKALKQS